MARALAVRWLSGSRSARHRQTSVLLGLKSSPRLSPLGPQRSLSVLSTDSSRAKGVLFEEQVVELMRALRCELQATQLSMDGGIDHQGVWTFPDQREVEIVTQCKNEKKPVGVQHVREFHGVLSFFPPNTLGVFAASAGYSIYAQRYFLRMAHPAVLCSVDMAGHRIASFLLNDKAQALLPKLTVATQFVDHEHALVLTYGRHILGAS